MATPDWLSSLLAVMRKPIQSISASTRKPRRTSDSSLEQTESEPNFRWMAGRRFRIMDGFHYFLPNDEGEMDRLTLQHFLVKSCFEGSFSDGRYGRYWCAQLLIMYRLGVGRNYLSPIGEVLQLGGTVLDVGCGPGTWTLFVGVDISELFPMSIKPTNCTFHTADVNDGLPFADNSFDFVYMRYLITSLTAEEWVKAILELIRVLKPGGYIELWENDVQAHSTGPLSTALGERSKYSTIHLRQHQLRLSSRIAPVCPYITFPSPAIHAMKARGIDPSAARQLKSTLLSCGLQDVNMQFTSIPIGWRGQIGKIR
ncbi:S-adenosyl-L-methionine-dependent methyltransferase [Jimgerdemannia flammicorona]|uniref:S-adenosyl-L-methionine-dependent methyltransferase n=1 Tax=Jimgerdemannia flammicorona TaxID=994334 RepID=A0A433DBN8_9FUNG|nr:S-adenosyl-L-methionine-dependent methyltransferase [Jimgerdemannia flammicorona]